ncbi:hypothetical protein EJB05_50580, partial [Eragrostis curvula]
MGSCVSKKAARAGAAREAGKVAARLPPAKEHALSPVVEEEEEEEVKEVVLSETPAPRSPPEPVKKRQELSSPEEEEACSGSESASVAKEKAMAKAGGGGGDELQEEVVKRAIVDAPEKAHCRARRTEPAPDQETKPKPKQPGNGRARSPSPSSAHRRQHQQQQNQAPPPPAPSRPRREPAVVSAFGCRSGRFSPSAARRAAESAVRRSHSAREADMALPAKRCLSASINGGHGSGGSGVLISRRDPGERSGRRSDSPTASKRPSPAPSPVHRQAARENLSSTPERSRPRVRDNAHDAGRGGDEQTALAGGPTGGGERKKAEEGVLGQNPSVAMECFIFL